MAPFFSDGMAWYSCRRVRWRWCGTPGGRPPDQLKTSYIAMPAPM